MYSVMGPAPLAMAISGDVERRAETEADESQDLFQTEEGYSQGPTQHENKRKLVIGTLVVAALITAGAIATLAPHLNGTMAISPGYETLAVAGATHVAGMGCDNWDKILMLPTTNPSPDDCFAECSSTPGCVSFNYQPADCDTGGVAAQTCYLYNHLAECMEGANQCWDLYYMDAPPPSTFQLSANMTGCSNWASVEIGTTQTDLSYEQCKKLCSDNAVCVAFNYQHGPCSGDEMMGEGACMLFSGECERESNPCWDLYTTGG